jgi:hypothetical protein
VENPKIAVLISCDREEKTIGEVITEGFRRALAGAQIRVYDNNPSPEPRHENEL